MIKLTPGRILVGLPGVFDDQRVSNARLVSLCLVNIYCATSAYPKKVTHLQGIETKFSRKVRTLGNQRLQNFVALYRGATLKSAHLIGVTEEPDIILKVALALHPQPSSNSTDDVIQCLEVALLTALDLIEDEAAGAIRQSSN